MATIPGTTPEPGTTPAMKPDDGEMLRAYLAERDAHCPGCGYNLRGLKGGACPECGRELMLRVGLAHSKLAAFVTGLTGLAAGTGFSFFLMVYLLTDWLRRGRLRHMDQFFTIIASGFAIEGAALLLWLWYLRRVQSGPVQWVLGVGCWGLSVANALVFSFNIR